MPRPVIIGIDIFDGETQRPDELFVWSRSEIAERFCGLQPSALRATFTSLTPGIRGRESRVVWTAVCDDGIQREQSWECEGFDEAQSYVRHCITWSVG